MDTGGAPASPSPDAFAKVVCAGARLLNRHHRPLLARVVVQLLLRAPGREVEITDTSGHRQRLDTRDQMGANLLVGRYRLPAEVMARLRLGDWAIDCGANIGVVASQLSAAVGSEGLVWALEPVPENVARLRFLRERNGLSQLEVFPVAAGAEEGVVSIGLPPPGRSGWGSITKSWDVRQRSEVRVSTIDGLVQDAGTAGRRVRLLKIDVEGYEFEVLEGAASVLRNHAPLVYCEFNDVLLHDRGRSSTELLTLFADLGYRPAETGGDPAPTLPGRVVNLLLVPPDPGQGA